MSAQAIPVIYMVMVLAVAEYLVPEPGRKLRPVSLSVRTIPARIPVVVIGFCVLFLFVDAGIDMVTVMLLMGAGHFLCNGLKAPLYQEEVVSGTKALWLLVLYFVAHGGLILTGYSLIQPEAGYMIAGSVDRWLGSGNVAETARLMNNVMIVVIGYVVAARGGGEVVRAILDTLRIEPTGSGGDFRIGQMVGYLERFLLLTFVLLGELGALGFVIAAKSIARYSGISESREFAEYYLVGTLTSAVIAIVLGIGMRGFVA